MSLTDWRKRPLSGQTASRQTRVSYDTQSAPGIGKPYAFWVHCAPLVTTCYMTNMNPKEIEQLIQAGFDDVTVEVASNDNTHFEALVISREFEGKRPLARHQLVYKTLGTLVGNEIHALSIRAVTPSELQEQ